MSSIVPLSPLYTFSASIPVEDVPRSPGAIDALLVSHLARDLAAELTVAGHDVSDLNTILEGSQITASKTPETGHILFVASFPHPPGNKPGEMHPLQEMVIELVGGPQDGYRPPWKPGDSEEVKYAEATYARTGYNLADGSWQYQLQKTNAPVEDGA